jgi:hypothetical protein
MPPCPTMIALKGISLLITSLFGGHLSLGRFGTGVSSAVSTIRMHATSSYEHPNQSLADLAPLFDALGGPEEMGLDVKRRAVPMWIEEIEQMDARRRMKEVAMDGEEWWTIERSSEEVFAVLYNLDEDEREHFARAHPWHSLNSSETCATLVEVGTQQGSLSSPALVRGVLSLTYCPGALMCAAASPPHREWHHPQHRLLWLARLVRRAKLGEPFASYR